MFHFHTTVVSVQLQITTVVGAFQHQHQHNPQLIVLNPMSENFKCSEVNDNIPWEDTFRISGLTITSGSSWHVKPLVSFLVSPHRLEPPCMLGMFNTATPSRDRPLRSSGVPQHWERYGETRSKVSVHCLRENFFDCSFIFEVDCFKTRMHTCNPGMPFLCSYLDCQTFVQFLAGSRDGFWSGKFKIPQLVLHSAVTEKCVFQVKCYFTFTEYFLLLAHTAL